MTTKDLVIPKGLVISTGTEGQRTLAELLLSFPVLDADDIEERSLLEELSAATADQLFKAPDIAPLDEMTGEPFWLRRVVGILPSTVRGHEGEPYMLLEAQADNGAVFTISTGSPYCMRRAASAAAKGLLPRRVMSISKQSKGDPSRWSLWIVDAPKPTGPVTEATARPVVDDEPF